MQRFDDDARAKHPAVIDGLELLGSLHFERNRRATADTIDRMLSETRAHASLAMWPSGEQALANAIAIVDLARNFDSRVVRLSAHSSRRWKTRPNEGRAAKRRSSKKARKVCA